MGWQLTGPRLQHARPQVAPPPATSLLEATTNEAFLCHGFRLLTTGLGRKG